MTAWPHQNWISCQCKKNKSTLLGLRQGNDGIRRYYTDVYKECLVHSQKKKRKKALLLLTSESTLLYDSKHAFSKQTLDRALTFCTNLHQLRLLLCATHFWPRRTVFPILALSLKDHGVRFTHRVIQPSASYFHSNLEAVLDSLELGSCLFRCFTK